METHPGAVEKAQHRSEKLTLDPGRLNLKPRSLALATIKTPVTWKLTIEMSMVTLESWRSLERWGLTIQQ
jgi:hypothetical protein